MPGEKIFTQWFLTVKFHVSERDRLIELRETQYGA